MPLSLNNTIVIEDNAVVYANTITTPANVAVSVFNSGIRAVEGVNMGAGTSGYTFTWSAAHAGVDTAPTWKKLATIALPNTTSSFMSMLFTVNIGVTAGAQNTNFGQNLQTSKFTAQFVRATTVVDNINTAYFYGTTDLLRIVHPSAGTYEVQIKNYNTGIQYRVDAQVIHPGSGIGDPSQYIYVLSGADNGTAVGTTYTPTEASNAVNYAGFLNLSKLVANNSTVWFDAGTNTAPTVSFAGRTSTGFYSPSADTFVGVTAGLEAFRVTSTQQLLVTGGLGFFTGSGGTVTQTTSKSTAVTLDKMSGAITTNTAALNASTAVQFTLNNNKIANTDTVIINVRSPTGKYRADVVGLGAGTANIELFNSTAGSLSEAVVLNFNVIKGVNA